MPAPSLKLLERFDLGANVRSEESRRTFMNLRSASFANASHGPIELLILVADRGVAAGFVRDRVLSGRSAPAGTARAG
jgi:hypothetical protein